MKYLLFLFFLIPLTLPAQTLPLDSGSGKFLISEEVLVKDGPQTDLYNRAKKWFSAIEKNKIILEKDDFTNGLLLGKYIFTLPIHHNKLNRNLKILVTLKLELEDDRYWYSFSNFKYGVMPQTFKPLAENKILLSYPLENLLNGNKTEKEFNKLILLEVEKYINTLIEELKLTML